MELLEFDLERAERDLTLLNYERVKPEAEKLLGMGYTPVRVAALMFQYGYRFGRKLLNDTWKTRQHKKWEEMNQLTDEEAERRTSGENEGSV